ncbi:MAG: ribonuclease P protein component [Sporichthyaceae bacterium]
MLPAGARLRRRTDFASTLRAGRGRAGGTAPALLVVHLAADATDPNVPPKAGFVVSRTVGGAVVRNRVRRQLRHLVAARLGGFRPGTRLVVRALPSAAAASWAELETALDSALSSALKSAPKSAPGQRP